MSGRGGAGADLMTGGVVPAGAPVAATTPPLSDSVRVEAPEGDARTSWAYLALAALVAALATMTPTGGAPGEELLVLMGITSLVALLFASERLRNHPAPSWMTTQRDPFLLFAGALGVLVVPHLPSLIDGITVVERHAWLAACIGGVLAIAAFVVMISDQTPARALDALYLAAIGALAVGLVSWVAVLRAFDTQEVSAGRALQLLAPAVLDVLVVGIGLQAVRLRDAARQGCLLFVLAWTVLLAADVARLLAAVTDGTTADEALMGALMMGFALVGAAALHPHSTQAVDRVLDPIRRMPRAQVGLLLAAVLLGPVIVGLQLDEAGARSLVLTLSGALSILVVVHLVRLVQGRAALEHQAHHDELTGLANSTLFGDRAAVAIAHARRAGTHSAVLFLDLDRFKNVNDSLGHSVGNLLLQAVAKRLRGATRAEDTVARLGGDEFVVFLPEVAHPEEAATVAAKILHEFEQPFALSGHRLFASPSIGIAVFPQDGDDADGLLESADTAMYRAKARGRRTFCAYDRSMNDHAHERLALESRLHTAIERGELRLHYQPKIHMATGQMTGMEALLRWEHPELGLLEPSEFISLAEDSGLIVPVGEWALHEACRQNQAWADAGFPELVVAVNMSLRQFQQQQIEDVTARILRSTRLDPARLELEVTESLATQDGDAVRATLFDLREMGVRCAIDDFGTGYSGLSHLTQFPIDKLKIDKSFVATIDGHREAPIVVAVVALAHGLGLEVVAEGVETAAQLERLRELGCDEMQGYLFSRPLPPARFEALLRGLAGAGGGLVPLQPGR